LQTSCGLEAETAAALRPNGAAAVWRSGVVVMADEPVKPTRMELIKTKERIKLAGKGHKLLKQKRDVLVLEFFAILKKAKDLRSVLNGQMKTAFSSLAVAQAYHSVFEVEAAALAVKKVPNVRTSVKNIMGVRIADIEGSYEKRAIAERGYSFAGSSAKIDETASTFESSLGTIIEIAKTENALRNLLKEIETTKRRVNALEYVVVPRLKGEASYISMRLDEMEREGFFTLKMLKKKMNAKPK
jgi:V/A-type H+-transporting ATPase subunit D